MMRTLVRETQISWQVSYFLLVFIFNMGYWAFLLLKPYSYNTIVIIDNVAAIGGPLLGVGLAMGAWWRRDSGLAANGELGVQRWASFLLGLGILFYVLGGLVWACYQIILRQPPFPSLADPVYLARYPFLLAGILLLPMRRLSNVARVRAVMDSLLAMAAVVTFSWYFVLGPTIQQGGETLLAKVTGTAYPLADLVLFFSLLVLWVRMPATVLRGPLILISAGLTLLIVVDSVFDYQSLQNSYFTGELIDPLWSLGYMLIGLAAGWLRRIQQSGQLITIAAESASTAEGSSIRQILLPYAFVPSVGLLLIFTWNRHADSFLSMGVIIGTIIVVGLILLRQILAMHELRISYTDNAALSAANSQLEVMATTDALTALPNRTLLQNRLGQYLDSAQVSGQPVTLLLMDLDRFKEINDTLGHHCGDMLLQQIGPRLRGLLRGPDLVARLGGDEFALVLPDVDQEQAAQLAQAILHVLDVPFTIEGQPIDVGASIGIAVHPAHGIDVATLLRCADVAMYQAKRLHCGIAVYDAAQDQHSTHRLTLMSDLRQALASDDLLLYYQPKIERATNRLIGVEALLRWRHPQHGFIPPDHFIPLAEHTGLIVPLTRWVLKTALHQRQVWQRQGLYINLALNLSARMLHDPDLPALIHELLQHYDCPPDQVTLEITESALMVDPVRALEVVTHLARMRVHISIDDFGTGYSSLGYLQQLPVDEIKIDKSFVLNMGTHAKDTTLVRSIIAMAHALGLAVVAEGVETAEVFHLLGSLGCDVSQGYYISRPLPAADLEWWGATSPWGWTSVIAAPTRNQAC